jgi:hypothetical protein
VLEQVGQALGADRGLQRSGRSDVASDERQFPLDRGREPPGAVVDQRVQASDGAIEAFDGERQRSLAAGPVIVE